MDSFRKFKKGTFKRMQNFIQNSSFRSEEMVSKSGFQRDILTDTEGRMRVDTKWFNTEDPKLIFWLIATPLLVIGAIAIAL